jgi:hypothetical protein
MAQHEKEGDRQMTRARDEFHMAWVGEKGMTYEELHTHKGTKRMRFFFISKEWAAFVY